MANCAPWQRTSAPLPKRSARQRQGETSTAVYIPCQSHIFISCIICSIYNVVFKAQYFQLTLSGIRKDGKQLLPDYDKFIPFDVPNHDDWNDLFNDPVKLEDKLIRSDGRK